MKHGVYIV